MDLNVIPECYIDTKLIKVLCPPKTRYNHQKGCSNVMKLMQTKLKNDFALGIIDEDKRVMLYAEEFQLLNEVEGLIKLLKHPSQNHFIIYICPAVEKWLLAVSQSQNINLSDFGLPTDIKGLVSITKTTKSENNGPHSTNFRDLFKALKSSESQIITTLVSWIEHLKSNPYNADLELLKS